MSLAHAWSTPLAVALSFALATSVAPHQAHAKEGKRETTADARPFIEETRVVAPRRVGDFELEGSRYDPARKDAGVAFRYRLPAHPEMRIDLFVYPAGLMPEQDAIAAGMTPFLATFEEGVRQKYYDRFELLERTSFEIAPQAVPPTSAAKAGIEGRRIARADGSAGRRHRRDRLPAVRAGPAADPWRAPGPALPHADGLR